MSSKLSAVAQLQILRLLSKVDYDYGWWFYCARRKLPTDWRVVDHLFNADLAAPPESYLRSRELAMIQKDAVSEDDLSFIFSHGQPLVFEACPGRLVPKLIEAFQGLREEPSFLHVTIMFGDVGRIEVSPPLYVDRFPCTAYRQDACVQLRFRPDVGSAYETDVKCVIDKFHICSKHFGKQLSLELYSSVRHVNSYEDKFWAPFKVTVRVEDPVCGVAAVPSSKDASARTTMMMVPEFAVEVYGFLDRTYVGSSLLTNRRMHDCLSDAKGILPVHQLSCELQKEQLGYDEERWECHYSAYYWLILHHVQPDFPRSLIAREFKLCGVMSPQEECALALRYLSNSYIARYEDSSCGDSRHAKFFLRLLGALASRNVSVGHVKLDWFEGCVRDYRALVRAFDGQLPITALCVSLDESTFVGLVKITDFFRYPAVQRLKKLCLSLHVPWGKSPSRMGPTPNPLWIDGILQLRNCEKYEVHYAGRRIRSAVPIRLVQICEKFERGEVSEIVQHFALRAHYDVEVAFPFSFVNLVASRVNVVADNPSARWAYVGRYEWDVYHFHNVVASKALTALVGHGHGLGFGNGTVLHLLRGAVYPDVLLTFRESH